MSVFLEAMCLQFLLLHKNQKHRGKLKKKTQQDLLLGTPIQKYYSLPVSRVSVPGTEPTGIYLFKTFPTSSI
jgi:hypothetical protein